MQLLGMLFLARLLRPADYGVMAIAMVVVNLANLLRDMGTSAAVVQRKELPDDAIATIFWLNVVVGVILAIAISVVAKIMVLVFASPNLPPVLWLLALGFPITASSAVHQALLERDSRFKLLARIEIVSSFAGLLVAALLASFHFGVYCLPFQILTSSILSCIQLWVARSWYPKRRFSRDSFRQLLGYSGNLTVFSLINYLARNMDSIVIGKVLGAVQLGIYSQAYRVMLFPLQNMTFVATRALFPILSGRQHDIVEARKIYLKTVTLVVTITAPLMGGMWILRSEFVQVIFGAKWMAVVPVLAWLAPVGFIQSIVSTSGTVFMALGNTDKLMRLGVIATILQVGGFFIGVRWDINHVAAMYCLSNVINFVIAMEVTMRELGGNLMTLLVAISRPIVCTSLMLAGIWVGHRYLAGIGVRDLPLAIYITMLGTAVYGAAGFGWMRSAKFAFHGCEVAPKGGD